MNSFSGKISLSKVFNTEENKESDYSKKYSDCVAKSDYLQFFDATRTDVPKEEEIFIEEIDLCLENYQRSLNSTIKNLNAIDAHEFLHSEYLRCKIKISTGSLSEIQKYYHRGIMQICYDKDRFLNLGSNGNVTKL
ncbi:hypothetical protein DKG77_07130 [Flagellimonas aquimarina]|uniref:Uncharacterized protein n=2 Tax=Flagellimonas aquimarina TaxID=2201895 RepID=A0A316KZD1_9FLAO|nr:hypothetical protein DKG77_07130 [Allomuricauda koreensis]